MLCRFGAIVEGLMLVVIGSYAGWLVLGDDYWRFLNPKFKWLTGTAAVLVLILGTVAALYPERRPRPSRIVIFLALIALLVVDTGQRAGPDDAPRATPKTTMERQGPSRVTLDGAEYIRINLAELYVLCEQKEIDPSGHLFVARGIYKRNEELDRTGHSAVLRNLVTCCLADAIGIGLRVEKGPDHPAADGDWVEVYGRMRRLPEPLPEIRLRAEGIRVTVLSPSCVIEPTHVKGIPPPEIPFMFTIRDEEPFSY